MSDSVFVVVGESPSDSSVNYRRILSVHGTEEGAKAAQGAHNAAYEHTRAAERAGTEAGEAYERQHPRPGDRHRFIGPDPWGEARGAACRAAYEAAMAGAPHEREKAFVEKHELKK